jgi:hypothetical protein
MSDKDNYFADSLWASEKKTGRVIISIVAHTMIQQSETTLVEGKEEIKDLGRRQKILPSYNQQFPKSNVKQ